MALRGKKGTNWLVFLAGFEELLLYIQHNGVDEEKEGGSAAAAAAALCVATPKARYEKQYPGIYTWHI